MSNRRKHVSTVPEWHDVPLFEEASEFKATKADWMLHDEIKGPGAADKDVFIVWRYVDAYQHCTQAKVQRYLEIDHDWDFHRARKAIQQALGVRAVEFGKGDCLVASDCKHLSRSLKAARSMS